MPQVPPVAARPQLERDAIRGDLLGAQAQLAGNIGRPPGRVPVVPQSVGANVAGAQLSAPVPPMPVSGMPLNGLPVAPPMPAPGQVPPGMAVAGALPPAPLPNDPCTLLQVRLAALVQLMTPLGQELGAAIAAIDPAGALARQGVRPTTLQEILDEPETLPDLARFIEEELLSGRSGAHPDLGTLRQVADNARALHQDPMFKANVTVFDHLQQAAQVLDEEARATGCMQEPPANQAPPAQMPGQPRS